MLPDWATFCGRSDNVARLGYFLKTVRQRCQIGLLFVDDHSVARLGYFLKTVRQRCQVGLQFDDDQTVLPDWATL